MFKILAGIMIFWVLFEGKSDDGVSYCIAMALIGTGLDSIFFRKK